jgi:hypothetical protein
MVRFFVRKCIQEILVIHLHTSLTGCIHSLVYSAVHRYELDSMYDVSQENNAATTCTPKISEPSTMVLIG